MKIVSSVEIEVYVAENGKAPFIEWLESLKDKTVKYRIKERLDRVALGNFGDYKVIDEKLSELRFNFGSGYRVYFGYIKDKLVLLCCGGDKSTQKRDIKLAKEYLLDYLSEKK